MFTLRKKTILTFIIPGLLATGIVVSFLHVSLLDSAIQQWGPDNKYLIHTLKNHLVSSIDASKRLLISTSKQPAFSSLPYLDQVNPEINGIPEHIDTEKRRILETLKTDFGTFSVLFVLSPDGNHYISHPYAVQEKLSKFNLSDRPYFIEATRTKNVVISDSFFGADGIPAVAIDVPILNSDNDIIAHLGGVIHLIKLSKLLDAKVISPFDAGFIVDNKNQLIAQTKTPHLANNQWKNINKQLRQKQNTSNITQEFADPEDGSEYLVSSGFLSNGWLLALLRNKKSIIETVRPQVFSISFLVFFMLIAIGFIGFMLVIRMTQRWEDAERQLRHAHDDLEERVVARTHELEHSEQRFRRLFENSEISILNEDFSAVYQSLNKLRNDGIKDIRLYLQKNPQKARDILVSIKILQVNKSSLKLFNAKDKSEFIFNINAALGAAAIEVFIDSLSAIWDGKKTFRSEVNVKTLSGKQFIAIISFQIPDTEAGFKSIPVSILDISEQKAFAKNLRLASAVFETATEGIMVTDTNNKIQMVNNAFCLITGYKSEEVLGKDLSILKSSYHDDLFYKDLYETLHQKGTWTGEIWNRRKNGEIYPEWLAISTMRNDKGQREGYVSLFSDITKRKQDEEHILHQANYDSLTGLANRNLFSDRFSHALQQADRDSHQVALLFIDLDRFKYVNDTLGHPLGDQLLQEAGRRLVDCLRKSDTVARLGGDEFAVILPEIVELQNVNDAVIKILSSLALPYRLEDNDVFISASIGITIYPDDGQTTEVLIRNADTAMYKAKDEGRNGFHFFTLEMNLEAQQRRVLESALYKALDNKEFYLCFQPIIDMKNNTISSAEALIRWNHPAKGTISPAEFIPIAEEVGLIVPIGEWVIREACKAAVRWSKNMPESPCVTVNLSSCQFQRENIPTLVETVLLETGLAPEKLTLEITESLLVADNETTLSQLQKIRQLGVGLSIDDFGTGYSSLSYLKKFPINTLKIDRSFILELPANPEDSALVKGILSMAHSLNLTVVAEGVETQEQSEFLKSHHCQYVQGYFYSKPLSDKDFFSFLTLNT